MNCHSRFSVGSLAPISIILLHIIVSGVLSYFSEDLLGVSYSSGLFLYRLFRLSIMLAICFCILTSYSDPGFIYRILEPNSVHLAEFRSYSKVLSSHIRRISTENDTGENIQEYPIEGNSNSEEQINVIREVDENSIDEENPEVEVAEEGNEPEMKYCTVCHIEQPLRAKHCWKCGYCVVLFDHHCPWLGVCIGERNHRVFWWYLLCESIFLVLLFGYSLKFLESQRNSIGTALALTLASVFSLVCLLVLFLLILHSYLGLSNKTTWEFLSWSKVSYLEYSKSRWRSPFSAGLAKNIYFFWVKPLPLGYTIWSLN